MFTHITSFITKTAWTPNRIMLALVGVVGAVLGLAIMIALVGVVLRVGRGFSAATFGGELMQSHDVAIYAEPSVGHAEYDTNYGGEKAKMIATSYAYPQAAIAPLPPMPTVNGSRNAEKFERTGYNAQYETGHLSEVCGAIEALKPLEYVLFDSAYVGERNCNYVFRVESNKADDVVNTLKALEPKEWSVSVDTVAQQIENSTDFVATLQRRLASTEATMKDAEAAYARLTTLATQSGKVGDLTEIITQKLAMVERLTNEKLSLEEQIRQVTTTKTAQVDETVYAHFNVSVLKRDLVNWQNIRDMWGAALESTIHGVSDAMSDIVLGIPVLLAWIVFWALYGGISLLAFVVFVKYIWQWAVWVWTV